MGIPGKEEVGDKTLIYIKRLLSELQLKQMQRNQQRHHRKIGKEDYKLKATKQKLLITHKTALKTVH